MTKWCKEAGDGIEIKYLAKREKVTPTAINDTNVFWKAFHSTLVDDL